MSRAILILAAGAASRMQGRDKLLEPIGGQPLLAVMAERALEVSDAVITALPPDRPERDKALGDLSVRHVIVTDAAKGMSASIRAGLPYAIGARGVMILPADMPELTSADLRDVWEMFEALDAEQIVRGATQDGQPGHPVVFPGQHLADLSRITGDTGGRDLIARHGASLCPLPEHHALTDLDTPQAWADWRARTGLLE
jgi:CTP:molybdopterin cytidylyltransferase MocA